MRYYQTIKGTELSDDQWIYRTIYFGYDKHNALSVCNNTNQDFYENSITMVREYDDLPDGILFEFLTDDERQDYLSRYRIIK